MFAFAKYNFEFCVTAENRKTICKAMTLHDLLLFSRNAILYTMQQHL